MRQNLQLAPRLAPHRTCAVDHIMGGWSLEFVEPRRHPASERMQGRNAPRSPNEMRSDVSNNTSQIGEFALIPVDRGVDLQPLPLNRVKLIYLQAGNGDTFSATNATRRDEVVRNY